MLSKLGLCMLREYDKKPSSKKDLKTAESLKSLPNERIRIDFLSESKKVTKFLVGPRAFNADTLKNSDIFTTTSRSARKLPENSEKAPPSALKLKPKENIHSADNGYNQSVWEKLMKNNDLENTSATEMVASLKRGIPKEMRPRIWEFLTNTSRSQKRIYADGTYSRFSAEVCPCESWILADVPRTFASNPFFSDKKFKGEQKLLNILRAYANLDSEIGYTQGMNYIAGGLLIMLNPENFKNSDSTYFANYAENFEEKVFWIFVHIMYEKNWRSVFKPGTPKVIEMSKHFEKILASQIPEVLQKITDTNLSTSFLFNEMFITLLLMNCPLELGQRFMDLFLVEGEKVIFEVLIRALSFSKDKILQLKDDDQLNTFVRKQMFSDLLKMYLDNLQTLLPDLE